MKVQYSRRAQADIKAIYLYLLQHNQKAATMVAAAIYRQVARLADNPSLGPPTKRPGVRGLTIPRYPYKAYYRIRRADVFIPHIRDGRRAPWAGVR